MRARRGQPPAEAVSEDRKRELAAIARAHEVFKAAQLTQSTHVYLAGLRVSVFLWEWRGRQVQIRIGPAGEIDAEVDDRDFLPFRRKFTYDVEALLSKVAAEFFR